MKTKSRPIIIFTVLVGYILLQFIWWEILLVRQSNQIITEKQKLAALNIADASQMEIEIAALQRKRTTQTLMITGEGTVFLLILLYGIHRIRKAHAQESELNARQKNFFLSITHELKTPVAATKLQLQTLRKPALSEEQRETVIGRALAENERLNALIDNVLLASRLDAGEYEFGYVRCDLAMLVRDTVKRYFGPYVEKGAVRVVTDDDVFVNGDGHALLSVVTNLVGNALKFAGERAQVEVSVRRMGAHAILTVSDNGPGVKEQDRGRIFERFFRSGDETIRKAPGTGLGLYITEYIVKKHRGRITVGDNATGGAIFMVTLHAV